MESLGMILMVVTFGGIMYFLMIRPAKKQQQKQQEMLSQLETGSRIVTGSGIYGTIRHIGDKQAIIEISPGVDLTIARAAIRGIVADAEEEFEYSDSTEVMDQELENPFETDPDTTDVSDLSFAPPPTTGETGTDTTELK